MTSIEVLEKEAEKTIAHGSEVVHGASQGGGEIANMLEHHIMNSSTIEIPFLGEVSLPQIHLFGYDLSITKHVVMMWIASFILIILFTLAFRRKKDVPSGLALMLEEMVKYVRDEIAIKTIGEEGKQYTSYLLTTFFFILTCNLLGLIPYGATPTGNIGVTAALAGLAFIIIQTSGIIRHGPIGYFKSMAPHGVNVAILPIIMLIEFVGLFIKPFALCMRLFANMISGHIVILCFLALIFIFKTILMAPVSIAFALFIYFLELLVALIQAYIFTMLTSLFIGMSLHPQH